MKIKIIVMFSGGKDSQAALIWAVKKYGKENVVALYCDTGWEHEWTYAHVKEVAEALGVELVIVKSKEYNGMVDLAIKKGRFPSTKARFCTEQLKSIPAIDWILDLNQNVIIIQGIRKDESESRSKMQEACRYFKYYYEPYKITGRYDKLLELSVQELRDIFHGKVIKKSILRQIKRIAKKHKMDPVTPFYSENVKGFNQLEENRIKHFHTYRKDDVFEWCKKYDDSIMRPCFNWSGQEVIDYIIENGQNPNPLYSKGMSRVGCYPCVMASQGEIKAMAEFTPEYIDRLNQAELAANSSFFVPNYIPKRFCSKTSSKGVKYPTATDVVEYVTREKTIDMFNQGGDRSCMSFYGTCE